MLMKQLENEAKKRGCRIVFPEGEDKRIIKAAGIIAKRGIAKPIIINGKAKGCESIKVKGDSIVYGMLLVKEGKADCCVCGASHSTLNTIKNALHIIRGEFASSFFLYPEKKILFADCALNVDPTSEQLAKIAEQTMQSAKMFGIKPKIAFLSYSTKGSGKGPSVDKVREAVKIFRMRNPNVIADGELQIDSAVVPAVAKIKKSSIIKGDANVLIFPNLDAGNIGYKIMERFGKTQALGPVIQGLNKPVSDLSRGCSVDDIVNVAIITALQSKK